MTPSSPLFQAIIQEMRCAITQVRRLTSLVFRKGDPLSAYNFMGGHLGSLFGNFPDDEWDAMMKAAGTPCDEPGCDCHILGKESSIIFDKMRKDFKKIMAQNKGRN